ncbi:MAG: hypothetical protein H0T89_20405 [Deltaproteobacteria bacterium]|nr:hypothetical protein [Deltaproteobacteria bacterium]MDQ3297152.1 hypothetical protein [Myxococcota bacterium]
MTNTLKTLLTTLLVAIPLTAAAELPKPVADLERMVGTWKGTGTLAMGADTAKLGTSLTCKRTSAQFGVLCAFRVTGIPGMKVYEETDLFGYEPHSGTYHWFSVTSAGDTHDHVAKVTTGDKLEFVYTGTQEGKPLKEVIELTFAKDGKAMTVRGETFIAGASASVIEVKLRK